jgi:hypothetical protein
VAVDAGNATSARAQRKKKKVDESKNAFICFFYFRLFFGIGTFQRAMGEKHKKILRSPDSRRQVVTVNGFQTAAASPRPVCRLTEV